MFFIVLVEDVAAFCEFGVCFVKLTHACCLIVNFIFFVQICFMEYGIGLDMMYKERKACNLQTHAICFCCWLKDYLHAP